MLNKLDHFQEWYFALGGRNGNIMLFIVMNLMLYLFLRFYNVHLSVHQFLLHRVFLCLYHLTFVYEINL